MKKRLFWFFLSVSVTSTQSSKGSICEEPACVYITWKSSHKHKAKTHRDTWLLVVGFKMSLQGSKCLPIWKLISSCFSLSGHSPLDTMVTTLLLSQSTAMCKNTPGWLPELTQMCGQRITSCVSPDVPILFLISGFADELWVPLHRWTCFMWQKKA